MVAIWYLIVLAPLIAIPILWWNYHRKVRQRESESGARWEQFASATRTAVKEPAVAGTVAPPAGTAAGVAPAAVAAPQFARRARTLDAAQTVLYYLLKNALPDHEVMPQLTLASVLDMPGVAGSEREQRMRGLTQHTADFVVCNKALQVVAVIDLLDQEPPAALTAPADFKSRCLAQAGIRHLRLTRKNLPKRDAVRALVLGP